jgi:hypothetical protein
MENAMPRKKAAARSIPWWAWIVAGDLVLLGSIWLGGFWPRDPVTGTILSWLALHREMNLAVWWSAAQLLLGALLMYERASVGPPAERWPWAILAFVSGGLSLDEVGSVHERLADRTWWPLLFVAIPLVTALAWALVRLARKRERRGEVALVVVAYGLFAGVAGLEYLESIVGWNTPLGLGLTLEEGIELVAFLLLLFAATGDRRDASSGLGAVIPDPARLERLRSVLTLAMVPHAVIALFIAHHLTDLIGRGNPIVWYPFAVYGLLACHALTVRGRAPAEDRSAWGWLAGLFLVCSIGAVFPLTNLTPYIDRVFPRWVFEGTYATHLFLVPPVLLGAGRVLGWRHPPLRRTVALLAILVLVRLPGRIWWLDALTPGLVAYLWALLFVPRAAPGDDRPASRSDLSLRARG